MNFKNSNSNSCISQRLQRLAKNLPPPLSKRYDKHPKYDTLATKKKYFNLTRKNTKKFFLTFSNMNSGLKQKAKDTILNYFDDVLWLMIFEEYKPGNLHYHILIEFNRKKDIRNSQFFNFIFNKQGKYETCRSLIKSIEYLICPNPDQRKTKCQIDDNPLFFNIDPYLYYKLHKNKESSISSILINLFSILAISNLMNTFVILFPTINP